MLEHTDSSPPRSIALASPVVEVPLIMHAGHPMVEARINGRGPFRLLIETGARRSDLTPATAEALGLIPPGGDGLREFRVDSVTVGGATFVGVPMSTVPLPMAGVDGVLGLPVYSQLLLTLDYPAATVRFERGTLPAPNGSDILALTRIGDFWGVPFTAAGRRFDAVLDTQSGAPIAFSPEYRDSLTFVGPLQVVGRASGAGFSGAVVEGGQLQGDIKVGRYTFPKPNLMLIPLPPGLPGRPNIGSGLLRNFAVTLDQQQGRLRLSRTGSTEIELPAPRRVPAPAPPA